MATESRGEHRGSADEGLGTGEWGSRGDLTGRGQEQGHQPRLEYESEWGGGQRSGPESRRQGAR